MFKFAEIKKKIPLSVIAPYTFVRGAADDHRGSVDLAMPIGTPLKSPGTGKVVVAKLDPKGAGGNYVDILYPETNVRIRFMHLSKFLVDVGDEVRALEEFAYSGNSGTDTTGPHLHMQVYLHGNLINPLLIFSKA